MSICQLTPTPRSSTEPKLLRQNKYSTFMKKITRQMHSTTSSSDSLSRYHLTYKQNLFTNDKDNQITLQNSFHKDELFIILKGKNFDPKFQYSSKFNPNQLCKTQDPRVIYVSPHIANQRRKHLKRTKLLNTIQRQKLHRLQSQRKFLNKTLRIQVNKQISTHPFR